MIQTMPVHPTDHALESLRKRLGPGMSWRDVLDDCKPGNPWPHITTRPEQLYFHHPRFGLLFVLAKADNGLVLVTVRKPTGEALTIAHEERQMSTVATRMSAPPATGFALEWVAGGNNAKDAVRQRSFNGKGARALLTETFAKAGLIAAARRVQVTHTFLRSTAMPKVSGVLADKHGVRIRVRPERDDQGFLVVLLCEKGETPEDLAVRIETAAKIVSGGLVEEAQADPWSEPVYRRAADIAGELDPAESLPAFAAQVAINAGPGESPKYWMMALAAAEEHGLVSRNGTAFIPVAQDDVPAEEPEPPPVPLNGTVPTPPPPYMTTTVMPLPVSQIDKAVLKDLASSAGGMISILSQVQKLHDDLANLEAKKIEIDRQLDETTSKIRVLAKKLDFTKLALAADTLGT